MEPNAMPPNTDPLTRVLRSFNLEHHAQKLRELGFSSDLLLLARSSYENLRDISGRLHLTPE